MALIYIIGKIIPYTLCSMKTDYHDIFLKSLLWFLTLYRGIAYQIYISMLHRYRHSLIKRVDDIPSLSAINCARK